MVEAIAVEHGLAGGEGHPGRVDEAAAVAGDAIGVGDDDPGRLAGDLGVALELARAAAHHLVEDDSGRRALEVGVTDDDAAQLGVTGAVGDVVEDDAAAVDVVILELVVRQPVGAGRGDVDDGYAIAGLVQPGVAAAAADDDAVGLRPDRLPEHHVDQQQGQGALGNATEGLARLERSAGLGGKKVELADVHVWSSVKPGDEMKGGKR
ncbi:hypothetical protein QKY98_04130 [Pseudomonas sp. HR1]|nr:hypothetical protein [Pseudomonas sp. HR1]MDK4198298.1 hypothetical protein [Pseudomonas sp. HR1]